MDQALAMHDACLRSVLHHHYGYEASIAQPCHASAIVSFVVAMAVVYLKQNAPLTGSKNAHCKSLLLQLLCCGLLCHGHIANCKPEPSHMVLILQVK